MPEQAIPTITQARSRLGVASRRRDHAATTEARRDLAAAKLRQYIEAIVDEAPPLTQAQRETLTAIIHGGGAR